MNARTQGELVSVVMSAYNHADYVGEAIASVLEQSHENIEFLITDDGSSDGTVDEIRKHKDPRIQYSGEGKNQGACTAINDLISKARGDYICIINSDDIWRDKEKLKKQLAIFGERKELGACFGLANFVDQNGNNIQDKEVLEGNSFNQGNKTKGEWLNHFFMNGNSLCHPTIMIKKECYTEMGLYNNMYRQLPDYDMWIRLVKSYDIFVSEEKFTDFRILPGRNASSPTKQNMIRDLNEHYLIRKSFFENIKPIDLNNGFGKFFIKRNIEDKIKNEIETTLLYFIEAGNYKKINKLIGLEKISALIQDRQKAAILNEEYGIDAMWFHKKSGEIATIFESFIYDNERPPKVSLFNKVVGKNEFLKRFLRKTS